VGARTRGHGIARAGPQPDSDAQPYAFAEPHAHAAAHDALAHAVAGQPVTVPDAVRAGLLAVAGVADGQRAGIRGALGGDCPAVRPAG